MIKLSIFKNNFVLWIDYSKRKDCLEVKEITEEEAEILQNWWDYIKWKIVEYKDTIKGKEEIAKEQSIINSVENQTKLIKEKYSTIILEKYSLTDQLNMWNEALLITVTVQAEKRDFTEEELVRLNEIKEVKIWIDEQRELCANEILELK